MLRLRSFVPASRPFARYQTTLASTSFPSSSSASSSSAAPPLAPSSIPAASPEAYADVDATDAPVETRYHVARTAGGSLPVYSDVRNGGNHWRTIVRKVTGDAKALQADLNAFLSDGHLDPIRPAPRVTLRPTNRHLEVRGRFVDEFKAYLSARGF
ncbi:hypothetical protein Q5752_001325 [Cryptotrichosporon argae]